METFVCPQSVTYLFVILPVFVPVRGSASSLLSSPVVVVIVCFQRSRPYSSTPTNPRPALRDVAIVQLRFRSQTRL